MKQIVASKVVDIPDDVKFEVKARSVRVKGVRGALFTITGNGMLLTQNKLRGACQLCTYRCRL